MTVRDDYPYEVDIVDHTWITMADGIRLSAKLWLPRTDEPVPALLEYLPYRKDDFTYERDNAQHGYFAGHGYATARVDIRGTGDSEGILEDEYLPSEIADGAAVVAWMAAQEWCNGRVGMFGISWGGFNSLQVAAVAPPALEAIIAVAATDDRYATDVHYHGGAILASEMLPWASTMLLRNAIPPTPSIFGDRWRDEWLHRLENTPQFIEAWLSHQRRDAFWKHGSVGEDLAAIKCPVYIVGGLADGYADTALLLAAGMEASGATVKALLGPWSHNFPEFGIPGPTIGFLQEAKRWWDHWLRDIDTGIDKEDPVRIWVQDRVTPRPPYQQRPGRWITEPSWPPPPEHVAGQRLFLEPGALIPTAPSPGDSIVTAGQTHGVFGGRWWGYGQEGDLPEDQRLENPRAASFDSAPQREAADIVGFPELHLRVATAAPNGIVTAQLSDVAPDGTALLVARGTLNMSHRTSHEHPQPLEPGQPTDMTIVMGATAHRIEPGHRWRLTLSPTYWPLVWPLPAAAELKLFSGEAGYLDLPQRLARPDELEPAPFGPAEHAPSGVESLRHPERRREMETEDGVLRIIDIDDSGEFRIPGRATASMTATDEFQICDDDPLSARVRCRRGCNIVWEEAQVAITTTSEMWATTDRWHVVNAIIATADGAPVFDESWEFSVARDWA